MYIHWRLRDFDELSSAAINVRKEVIRSQQGSNQSVVEVSIRESGAGSPLIAAFIEPPTQRSISPRLLENIALRSQVLLNVYVCSTLFNPLTNILRDVCICIMWKISHTCQIKLLTLNFLYTIQLVACWSGRYFVPSIAYYRSLMGRLWDRYVTHEGMYVCMKAWRQHPTLVPNFILVYK